MKTSETLTVLAGRVAEPGAWRRGSPAGDEAPGCILWHLAKLLGIGFRSLLEQDRPEVEFLAKATGRAPMFRDHLSLNVVVWSFNDRPSLGGGTQEAVVDLCHRAARLAKEAGE